jgi:hypothetical protein
VRDFKVCGGFVKSRGSLGDQSEVSPNIKFLRSQVKKLLMKFLPYDVNYIGLASSSHFWI